MLQIRAMQHSDIAAVMQIQAACYVLDAIEAESTFIARLEVSPDTAWVVNDEQGVCAYLVGYYSAQGKVTPLGAVFNPVQSDCLYLHDLAILPRAAGQKLASQLVECALDQQPEHIQYAALVSIQNSLPFWQKLGFEIHIVNDTQIHALNSYPQPAVYMLKRLIK